MADWRTRRAVVWHGGLALLVFVLAAAAGVLEPAHSAASRMAAMLSWARWSRLDSLSVVVFIMFLLAPGAVCRKEFQLAAVVRLVGVRCVRVPIIRQRAHL